MKKIPKIFAFIIIAILLIFNINNFSRIIYKMDYSEYVNKYSLEYNVDPFMIYAIIKAESNFNYNATSNRGATGLMQLMDNTAKEVSTNETIDYESGTTLYNPEENIKLGTKYYSDLRKQFKNDNIALAAYNAGSGNVQKWIDEGVIKEDGTDIENIPFKETNTYVRKILKDYTIYRKLYT
ncbi:MAG: lytic transglycosylase domain-containing protein [Clostridia bacterium]|nr:lytic transglycosylase domain-containing protein [Clostridia bacterium]